MNAYCCSRPISRLRFLRNGRYRPPVGLRFDRPCQRAIGVVPTEPGYMTLLPHARFRCPYARRFVSTKPRSAPPFSSEPRLRIALEDEPHEEEKSHQASEDRPGCDERIRLEAEERSARRGQERERG